MTTDTFEKPDAEGAVAAATYAASAVAADVRAALTGGTSVDLAAWMLKRAFHFAATVTRIILTPPLAEG
jgi:hypothetical protein